MWSVDRAERRWAVYNDGAAAHVVPHRLHGLIFRSQRHANDQGGRHATAVATRVGEARLVVQYTSIDRDAEHATWIITRVARRVRLGQVQRDDRHVADALRKLDREAGHRHERTRASREFTARLHIY